MEANNPIKFREALLGTDDESRVIEKYQGFRVYCELSSLQQKRRMARTIWNYYMDKLPTKHQVVLPGR